MDDVNVVLETTMDNSSIVMLHFTCVPFSTFSPPPPTSSLSILYLPPHLPFLSPLSASPSLPTTSSLSILFPPSLPVSILSILLPPPSSLPPPPSPLLPPPSSLPPSLYHNIEAYWNSMNSICEESFDDQEKLNCGLKALGIKWFNNDSSYQNTTVTGVTKNGLKVSILPYDDICRQLTCLPEMRSRYYIWHKGGHRQRRDKVKYAKDGQTWFLRYHWNSILNNYTGVKWLQSIAYYMATHS